jgi:hypothetical protein
LLQPRRTHYGRVACDGTPPPYGEPAYDGSSEPPPHAPAYAGACGIGAAGAA